MMNIQPAVRFGLEIRNTTTARLDNIELRNLTEEVHEELRVLEEKVPPKPGLGDSFESFQPRAGTGVDYKHYLLPGSVARLATALSHVMSNIYHQESGADFSTGSIQAHAIRHSPKMQVLQDALKRLLASHEDR